MADDAKPVDISAATKAASSALSQLAPEPAPDPAARFSAAIDRLRSTTRWILAIFGAIGTAFLGTLPFVQLNTVAWPSWPASIIVGAIILLAAGLILVLRAGSEVFIARVGTYTDLATQWNRCPEKPFELEYPRYEMFRGMAESPGDLVDEWERSRHEMWRARMAAALSMEPDGKGKEEKILAKTAELAEKRYKEIDDTTNYVVNFMVYRELVMVYRWARTWIFVGGILVTAGVVAFFAAIGTSADGPKDPPSSAPTIIASVLPSPPPCPAAAGQSVVQDTPEGPTVTIRLGDTCQVLQAGVGAAPAAAADTEGRSADSRSPAVLFALVPIGTAVLSLILYWVQSYQAKRHPINDPIFDNIVERDDREVRETNRSAYPWTPLRRT